MNGGVIGEIKKKRTCQPPLYSRAAVKADGISGVRRCRTKSRTGNTRHHPENEIEFLLSLLLLLLFFHSYSRVKSVEHGRPIGTRWLMQGVNAESDVFMGG